MSISYVTDLNDTNGAPTSGSPFAEIVRTGGGEGDILLASIGIASLTDFVVPLSGFNVVGFALTSAVKTYFLWRLLGANEPSSYVLNLSSSLGWGTTSAIYRGVDPVTPVIDAQITTIASTSSPSVTGVTFGANGGLAVLMAAAGTSWGTHTPPSGFTARIPTSEPIERLDDKSFGSGATGSISWTDAGGPSDGVACVFGLNPFVAPFARVSGPTKVAPTVWQG